MNRLQKKCIIGTASIHLLLFLILIVGPAFFNQEPKLDNSDILTVIPSTLLDNSANSGVANARPPAPQPVVTPPQPLQQIPLPPKIVQPPTPAPTPPPTPTPSPSLLERFRTYFTPKPTPAEITPDTTPTERTSKPHEDNIKISTQLVKRSAQQNTSHTESENNSHAINTALRSLSHDLSSATKVDMPGNASASYANYATVVKSVYERAILSNLPSSLAHDNENTRVTITIASDGTVISSTIVSPSGDSAWDDAVQRTLGQVTFVAPFPDGATDKERHYTIDFNPKVAQELQ